MKELIDYFISVGADLINTKFGVIVKSEHLDRVELAKVQELCPDGFFVNPNTLPSLATIKKCSDEKKDIPKPSIGIFVGSSNDPLAHLTKLAENS